MTSLTRENSIKPLVWSVAGPVSVVLSVLLLVIKESPFYIDLSAVALFGLLIAWRFKLKGALAASVILGGVFTYDYFVELDPIGLWDFGLAVSIAFSFLITALASQETLEAIQKAGSQALSELASWEQKFTDLLHSNKALEADLFVSKERYLQLSDQLKAKIETSERAERLLKMATAELVSQTALREKTEVSFFDLKRELSLSKEMIQEQQLQIKAMQNGAEEHHSRLQSTLSEAEQHQSLVQDQLNQAVQHQFILQKKLNEAEEKLLGLAGQLEEMSDRLKALQSEKDELEKALDDALKLDTPGQDEPERGRYFGLYHQLHSQFLEKKEELFKARKENFMLLQQFLEFQRDREEEFVFDSTNEVKQLSESYKVLSENLLERDKEIEELEILVTTIFQNK